MGRIIAIDYGTKRTGLAWTDPLQMIATGIGSFATEEIEKILNELTQANTVVLFLLGYPTRLHGADTHSTESVRRFEQYLQKKFPDIPVKRWDERFTSKMAFQSMIDGGLPQKKRRNKDLVNEISATIILQEYLYNKGL